MQSQDTPPDPLAKAGRQPRTVFAASLRDALTNWQKLPRTCHAQALLGEVQQLLKGVTWVYWHSAAGLPAKSVPVSKICETIDKHVSPAIAAAEQQIGQAQIATLQVSAHPASALARTILEQHRIVMSDWSQARALDLSKDEFQQWRSFLSCGINLHNQTADLLNQTGASNFKRVDVESQSTAEMAVSVFGPMLLAGSIPKHLATEFVVLIADHIQGCRSMDKLREAILPAWRRVRDTIDHQPADMPVRELQLLYPRRLLQQPKPSPEPSKASVSPRAITVEDGLRMADDYERLAARLRYTPCLLASVEQSEPTLPQALDQVYLTAQSTLLASANLLRALCRKGGIHQGTEADNAEFLASLTPDDLIYQDEDLDEPEANYEELLQNAVQTPAEEEAEQNYIESLSFCQVCFRAAGNRKFCSDHLNTGGQARQQIKQAQMLLPRYKEALKLLQAAIIEPKNAKNFLLSPESDVCFTHLGSIESIQTQVPALLDKLLSRASWGLEANNTDGLRRLTTAVADVVLKVTRMASSHSTVWSAAVAAVADLQALAKEIDALVELLDLLLAFDNTSMDPKRLLGHELRLFAAAYTADQVCRIAAMFNAPHANAVALLPESLRDDFYAQWLNGYKPLFSVGHAVSPEARDADFMAQQPNPFVLDMRRLWGHFSRLAAWRVAQCTPGASKSRLPRLKSQDVLKRRKEGASVEDIAKEMKTTPEGVSAAIERWNMRGVKV